MKPSLLTESGGTTSTPLIFKLRGPRRIDFFGFSEGRLLMQGYTRGRKWWLCRELSGEAEAERYTMAELMKRDPLEHERMAFKGIVQPFATKAAVCKGAVEVYLLADASKRLTGVSFYTAFRGVWEALAAETRASR